MASLSNYVENKLLDHVLGTTSYTMPTDVYLALFTTNPTDAGSGTEVSGNGYARQVFTCDAASGGTTSNNVDIIFTASGGPFGTVTHLGVYDALTSGNLLFHTSITSRTVADNESISVDAGDLVFSLD